MKGGTHLRLRVQALALAAGFGLAMAVSVVGVRAADTVTDLQRAEEPAADALKSGLAITYYYGFFDFMSEMDQFVGSRDGVPGEPIEQIAVTGPEVFGSGREMGVGMMIDGFIKFDEAGVYTIAMHSNDGVIMEIGNQFILADPDKHSDRFSEMIPIEVPEPGLYPLHIQYFQKKGTWTLELYWLAPGQEGELELVPKEVYSHTPGMAKSS